jgi:hypothetical protein
MVGRAISRDEALRINRRICEQAEAERRPPVVSSEAAGFGSWHPVVRELFWARAGELGLTDTIVHAGFGVESMDDYPGTIWEAAAVLDIIYYAVGTPIGLNGMIEALEICPAEAVATGWTLRDVQEYLDWYIPEHDDEGEGKQWRN